MRAEGDAIKHHASVHKGCVCVDIRESGEEGGWRQELM